MHIQYLAVAKAPAYRAVWFMKAKTITVQNHNVFTTYAPHLL